MNQLTNADTYFLDRWPDAGDERPGPVWLRISDRKFKTPNDHHGKLTASQSPEAIALREKRQAEKERVKEQRAKETALRKAQESVRRQEASKMLQAEMMEKRAKWAETQAAKKVRAAERLEKSKAAKLAVIKPVKTFSERQEIARTRSMEWARRHRAQKGPKGPTAPIAIRYTKSTGEVIDYRSISTAAEENGRDKGHMRNACLFKAYTYANGDTVERIEAPHE